MMRRLPERLALAASPTFIVMALLGIVQRDDSVALLCSGTPGSPLGGMAAMYGLMAVFHAAPWIKLIAHPPPTTSARRTIPHRDHIYPRTVS